MTRLIWSFCLVVALLLLLFTEMAAMAGYRDQINQTPEISIRDFRAVDVSSGELRVTVDYTYLGAVQDVSIHATPEESGGVFDPRVVEYDELPVRTGTHSVTLSITKRPAARNFTSVAVRVCLSTPDRALLCQDFVHQKKWMDAAPPKPDSPPVDPPKPPNPDPAVDPTKPPPPRDGQTCSISGQLSGPLEGVSHPDHPGPPTKVRLDYMYLAASDGTRLRAVVKSRRYRFENLRPGTVYRVAPIGFQSKPRFRNVSCKASTHFHLNFQTIGPTPDG